MRRRRRLFVDEGEVMHFAVRSWRRCFDHHLRCGGRSCLYGRCRLTNRTDGDFNRCGRRGCGLRLGRRLLRGFDFFLNARRCR